MSIVKPFRGLRPKKGYAEKVASPPYDVLDSNEARELAAGNSYSFLHVNKPEIDLDADINPYHEKVYQKGAENLKTLINDGILIQDQSDNFYIYQQVMGNHAQVGLVASASVDEYEKNLIKKHELTRSDKEDDRVNHMIHLNAQVGPVFLTYRTKSEIDALISQITQNVPVYDFVSPDGVRHTFWVVDNEKTIHTIEAHFKNVDQLYVADGHHRSAAAQRVRDIRRNTNPQHNGTEEYNYFLTVIFPDNQMQILDYNRVVKDLNGLTKEDFLNKTGEKFEISSSGSQSHKPIRSKEFGMYLQGEWYKLVAKEHSYDPNDPVQSLDISILQENLLSRILGIGDPRKDKRIDFVGGIRGLNELEKRVNSGNWGVAFALYPTSIEQLMAIADAGQTMPPKSTWFEPKLRSGLIIHLLD
jgi:uncharacterized protein (DUF1015 family)